jgi:transposase
MASLADLVEVVIGVDTHKHTHTAAVVTASTGGKLDELTVDTDPDGYTALVEFADAHSGLRAWAIEGTVKRPGFHRGSLVGVAAVSAGLF